MLEGDARERRRLLLGWELKVSASRGKDGVATVKMEVQEGSHLGHCWWAGWVWKRAAHVAQSAAIEAKWRHMKRGAPQLAVKMAVQS